MGSYAATILFNLSDGKGNNNKPQASINHALFEEDNMWNNFEMVVELQVTNS